MEKIKKISAKILKERWQGFILLFFATFVISVVSLNSSYAKSQEDQSLAESEQPQNETQVLGEMNDDSQEAPEEAQVAEESAEEEEDSDVESQETADEENATTEETVSETPVVDQETQEYNELKSQLKKYCDKNGKKNRERCRKYYLEAKDASERNNDKYDDLWEKYKVTVSLVVTAKGKRKSYNVDYYSATSVINLMKSEKVSYDILKDGRMDNIGGIAKESGNMTWLLYLCKKGKCGLADKGASDCKVNDEYKIEWKYIDWSTIPNEDWNKSTDCLDS